MPSPSGQSTISPSYTLTYYISEQMTKQPVWHVHVFATPEEIQHLVEQGYLIRERLFQGEQLERLRAALDEVEAQERKEKNVSNSCVIIHSNLWHRALPTRSTGGKRRLLLFTYVPTWMRQAPYGVKPQHGLTEELLIDADEETCELLGLGGYT
jgi:hypothetical protein